MLGLVSDVQMLLCMAGWAGAKDCSPCQKRAKREGYSGNFKSVGRHGKLEEDLERCFLRSRRGEKDMLVWLNFFVARAVL